MRQIRSTVYLTDPLQAQWEAIVDHSAHRLSLEARAEAGEFGQFDAIADEWDELGSNQ
jgi:hypothetical protein